MCLVGGCLLVLSMVVGEGVFVEDLVVLDLVVGFVVFFYVRMFWILFEIGNIVGSVVLFKDGISSWCFLWLFVEKVFLERFCEFGS